MKKGTYFITAAAVKHWKKEVKSGNLRIATSGDKIYIVNSYNAFVIPNNNYIYSELVQPASLHPAPADGIAYIWRNGEMREDRAADTVNLVERIISADAGIVERTRFSVDTSDGKTCRIYKLSGGALAMVNADYDSMVDFTFKHAATMASDKSPAVFRSEHFTAVLLPVHPRSLGGWVSQLTEGIE